MCECNHSIVCPVQCCIDEHGYTGIMPVFKTKGAACADVASPKAVNINPGETVLIDLLLSFDIPTGYKIVMYPRSSLLIKKHLIQPVSIIDSDYHLHVHVPVFNAGIEPVIIEAGERVAQIECVPVYDCTSWDHESTERTGGFGSTGK